MRWPGHIDYYAQCRACDLDQSGVFVIGNIVVPLLFTEALYRFDRVCGALTGEYAAIEHNFQHRAHAVGHLGASAQQGEHLCALDIILID